MDPFTNPGQFGADLGGVKYAPPAQGRPPAIDRPSNWDQMNAVDRLEWSHEQQDRQREVERKAALAALPAKPDWWDRGTATDRRA